MFHFYQISKGTEIKSYAKVICQGQLHLKSHSITAVSWLCPVGSAMRGENTAVLRPRLLHQPGKKKSVCSSYGSWSFPPASWLMPCQPWVQRTAWTVWTTIHPSYNWRHEQDEQQYTHHTKKAVYILVYTFLIVFLAIRFLFHTLASYYQVITNYFKITSPWPTTIPVIGYSLFNLMPHLFGHLDHFQIFAVNNTCIAIYVS